MRPDIRFLREIGCPSVYVITLNQGHVFSRKMVRLQAAKGDHSALAWAQSIGHQEFPFTRLVAAHGGTNAIVPLQPET
jgi:hypothetical protein